MVPDPSTFEKLGVFYLGRPYDLATKQAGAEPVLYDSRDLTTHAVCVGMTGSGKTGLCLALLEEAAIDGIPAIVIDPKGDLGNLALTFPELRPEDFRPWINEEDAARKGMDADTYAARQAELWRSGLAQWGQGPERIRRLREKSEVVIYTPGSSAGVPVNVLASFEAPRGLDEEGLGERAQTAAAGLLSLLKINADAAQSREGILLTAILAQAWREGRNLDLEGLIVAVQHPPFEKLGVLDLETFFPAKDRFALVMALNNLLASPQFASWRQGAALDIGKMLATADGRARVAIFSIAHLGDAERMFFVSMLLNETLAWTRARSGTTSLRAILYMDEIFGYLPPTANPPSKQPMLTMLKQARAFGVGVVLATQNPVDLDYKALSNAGTWFIGRLQTERDKARVLDGLQGVAGGGRFDRSGMESTLAALGNRIFLMHNVHADGPLIFESRWAMSYLRGPLTREQIRSLAPAPPPSELLIRPRPVPAPASATATSWPDAARPTLAPSIVQVFFAGDAASYRPMLLASATLSYRDAKLGIDHRRQVALLAEIPEDGEPDWSLARAFEQPPAVRSTPAAGGRFADLPAAGAQAKSYERWVRDFQSWLGEGCALEVLWCADLGLASKPGEAREEFRGRLALAAREARDARVEALRKKYAPRRAALETKIARADAAVAREQEQAGAAKMQTAISIGSGLLGALLGGRKLSATNVTRAGTALRGVNRSMKQSGDVARAKENASAVRAQLDELEAELAAEIAGLGGAEPSVETVSVRPARPALNTLTLRLAWVPEGI